MRNGAHASDSPPSALRERRIVGLLEPDKDTCDVIEIVNEFIEN
jgi:hypothetical protein